MATIADKLTTIAGIKTDIRTAINGKGGSLTSGSPFSAYSAAISSLPSGGGYPPDWSEIGYTGAPDSLIDNFNKAKEIAQNWNPSVTSFPSYYGNKDMVYMPVVDTSNVNRMEQSFASSGLEAIGLLDTSHVTTMSGLFFQCGRLVSIPQFNTSACTDLSYFLKNCPKIKTIPLLDTSSATNMMEMFRECSGLTSIPQLNTSACTNMSGMFTNCINLASVPLLNTSSVTNMKGMFSNCRSLTSIPQLNTSSVTNMQGLFSDCTGLTSIPQLNTSSVTNMQGMFYNCMSLTSIPQLNTSACTDMGTMFYSCDKLESIPAMDTSNVTSMRYFMGGSGLTKVTSLDMSKVTTFENFISTTSANLRFMLLKGLGTPSGVTSYTGAQMTNCTNWGVDSTDIPDARQSLVDSLLTYSFDRAAAGYATCEIKLSSDSYGQLTPQELADIQAKGYNITK